MSAATIGYLIEAGDLARLERVMRRLFSEDRMDGDAMRDAAQALEMVVRVAREYPVTDADVAKLAR